MKRLLHPEAYTKLILQQYVFTIKFLRIVDSPGVLLFKVADPIRRYLGERPLQQTEFEDFSDANWEPEPIDARPEFRTNKPSDVISTFVGIHASRDLFVKELQVLLAQRLLMITKYHSDRVEAKKRNIEILKIPFGEIALQVCEVTLTMTDSKRIDGHVHSHKASILHPTIISRHFWPALESSDLVMPGQFRKLQEEFAHESSIFKPDKKLTWLPHLGTVWVELQLEDRKIEVDAPPLEAAFIELFSDKPIWTLEALIIAVGYVDRSAAVKALSTWVDLGVLGVLKEHPEITFRLLGGRGHISRVGFVEISSGRS